MAFPLDQLESSARVVLMQEVTHRTRTMTHRAAPPPLPYRKPPERRADHPGEQTGAVRCSGEEVHLVPRFAFRPTLVVVVRSLLPKRLAHADPIAPTPVATT